MKAHMRFWFCDEGSGALVQMCRFVRVLKSHFLAQMVIGVPWVPFIRAEGKIMRAAKSLASLYICTGSPEHSSLDNVITAPKSRTGNLCVIYASSEGSAESAYLRRLA